MAKLARKGPGTMPVHSQEILLGLGLECPGGNRLEGRGDERGALAADVLKRLWKALGALDARPGHCSSLPFLIALFAPSSASQPKPVTGCAANFEQPPRRQTEKAGASGAIVRLWTPDGSSQADDSFLICCFPNCPRLPESLHFSLCVFSLPASLSLSVSVSLSLSLSLPPYLPLCTLPFSMLLLTQCHVEPGKAEVMRNAAQSSLAKGLQWSSALRCCVPERSSFWGYSNTA